MANDASQIADAFKAAGEAMAQLGRYLEKYGTEEIITKPEKPLTKRKHVIKDKNAPKKNYSSYLHFCTEERPQLQKEHPTLQLTEIAKLLGEKWNNLSAEDKEPYQKAAKEDKERYEREMTDYSPLESNTVVTENAKKPKSKSSKPTTTVAADVATSPPDTDTDADNTTTTSTEKKNDDNTTTTSIEKKNDDKDKKKKKKKKKKHHKNKD